MDELTPKERELLQLIVNYYRQKGVEVEIDRAELRAQLAVEDPRLSKLRKSLAEKGYLSSERNSFALTETTIELINRPSKRIRIEAPVYLPLYGQVKAGRSSSDELRVEYNDSVTRDGSTISIPHLDNYEDVYLLQVTGNSMEHEGIFAGDYAIIKPFSRNQYPRQRELVVAKYLPPKNESYIVNWDNIDDELLEGPTIKYYTYVASAERAHRLSWKTSIRNSEYTIESKYIVPQGRVMGVYRELVKEEKSGKR